MFAANTCTVVMLRACLLAGEFRAEGEKISGVPLLEAHEACNLNAWARFIDPRDAERANTAARVHLQQQLARIERDNAQRGLPLLRRVA
jgi:hypothetical protein